MGRPGSLSARIQLTGEDSENWFLRACLLIALAALLIGLAGCSSAPPAKTSLMEDVGGVEITKRELETIMYRYGYHYAGEVELAALEIYESTDDQEVRARATEWVTLGVPEMMRRSFNHEPMVGMAQAWLYAALLREYFTTGPGHDRFGAHQDVAVRVSKQLEADIVEIVAGVVPPARQDTLRMTIDTWIEGNGLANHRYFASDLESPAMKFMGAEVAGGLSATGAMNEQMVAMADRTNLMMAFMPRQLHWQTAETLSASREMVAEITDSTMSVMSAEIDASLERILAFAAEQRSLTAADLAFERGVILQAAADERSAMLSFLSLERNEIFKEIARERYGVMQDINEITLASLSQSFGDGQTLAEASIDRMFTRTLYLAAIPSLLVVIALVVVALWIRTTVNRLLALRERELEG